MKNVWLLGDSIRLIGYGDYVKENIGEGFKVFAPADNCRFAKYTLWELEYYIRDFEKPDVIHWNNGIWDISKHNGEEFNFTPLKEYIRDMQRINKVLKSTGAKVIFATTTPTLPQKTNLDIEDIKTYNNEITSVLKSEGVFINDLFSVVCENKKAYIKEDGVHLTKDGSMTCANAVIAAIKALI